MIMKLIHAIAALLTVLLVFIKQGYTYTTEMKVHGISYSRSPCGEKEKASPVDRPPADGRSNACMVCARASRCSQYGHCGPPRCKRDPDIVVDNEEIGTHPCDE